MVGITDQKIQQICREINDAPESNVISLLSCFGDAVRFTLLLRGKQVGMQLTEKSTFEQLLSEATAKPYYSDNAVTRFLKNFQANFGKSSYDMLRHSERYVPDIQEINGNLAFLEELLSVTFPRNP